MKGDICMASGFFKRISPEYVVEHAIKDMRISGLEGLKPYLTENAEKNVQTIITVSSGVNLLMGSNHVSVLFNRLAECDWTVDEILKGSESAKAILRNLGLRKEGITVISCPTCGRTEIDLVGLANQVESMVVGYDMPIKVAVMGCVVNGPGEAKEADIGIAGGKGCGLLIKHGEIVKKLDESELLGALTYELDHWKS